MREFLLLIREPITYSEMSDEEMQADIDRHMNWIEGLVEKGHFREGNPLEFEGIVITGENASPVGGPYIDRNLCISGYYILYAQSLDEAAKIVSTCPSLATGASIELRSIIQIPKG